MEQAPEYETKKHNKPYYLRLKTYMAVGAMTLVAAVGVKANNLMSQSGERFVHPPETSEPGYVDSQLSIINWNVEDKVLDNLEVLENRITEAGADAVMLQEVNAEDAEALAEYFDEWYTVFVLGERLLQDPGGGGFGNVLMTKQEPQNIKTLSIESDSLLSKGKHMLLGLFDDVAHAAAYQEPTIQKFKEGMQERRAAIAASINIGTADGEKEVRLATSHISPLIRIRDKQLNKLAEFLSDEIKEGRPLVFCGDLNADPEKIILMFTKMGFVVPQLSESTTVYSNKTIDHCMYRDENVLGLGAVTVKTKGKIPAYYPDHHPLEARWTSSASNLLEN